MKPIIPLATLLLTAAAACGDSASTPATSEPSSASDAGQKPTPWKPCDADPSIIYCDQFENPATKSQWKRSTICDGSYDIRGGNLEVDAQRACIVKSATSYTIPPNFTFDLAFKASSRSAWVTTYLSGAQNTSLGLNVQDRVDLYADSVCARVTDAPREEPAPMPRRDGGSSSDDGLVDVIVTLPTRLDPSQYHTFRLEMKDGAARLYADNKLEKVGENCSLSGPLEFQLTCSGADCSYDYIALRKLE